MARSNEPGESSAKAGTSGTPTEYRIIALLARHSGKVVTQNQIVSEVWGSAKPGQEHHVRVYMHQLRQKLEAEPARPRYLITEPWVGYRLREEGD